jgi:hypothetical protein
MVRGENAATTCSHTLSQKKIYVLAFVEFNFLKEEFLRDGIKLKKFEASKLCSISIYLRERLKRIQPTSENQKSRIQIVLEATGQIIDQLNNTSMKMIHK